MNLRPQLIVCLLRQLHQVHPVKLRIVDLVSGCDAMGFPGQDEKSLASVLEDMQDKALVERFDDPLDASVKRFKRTEAARVLLAEHGHI